MSPDPATASTSQQEPWKVEVRSANLKATIDDAVLALRMGVAVTAIRAAHRLTLCADDANGPSAQGERLWAFVLAVGYLHEVRVTLHPHFPRVREWALEAGTSEAEMKLIGQLFSGRTPLGQAMDRIRNELVFHCDEDAVRAWVANLDADTVIWAEGSTSKVGSSLFRAAADSVSASLLPDAKGDDPAPLRRLIEEAVFAMEVVLSFMEHAMSAYVIRIDGRMRRK